MSNLVTPAKLKVVELRHQLSSRGLSTTGLKKDLVARLELAIHDEEAQSPSLSAAAAQLKNKKDSEISPSTANSSSLQSADQESKLETVEREQFEALETPTRVRRSVRAQPSVTSKIPRRRAAKDRLAVVTTEAPQIGEEAEMTSSQGEALSSQPSAVESVLEKNMSDEEKKSEEQTVTLSVGAARDNSTATNSSKDEKLIATAGLGSESEGGKDISITEDVVMNDSTVDKTESAQKIDKFVKENVATEHEAVGKNETNKRGIETKKTTAVKVKLTDKVVVDQDRTNDRVDGASASQPSSTISLKDKTTESKAPRVESIEPAKELPQESSQGLEMEVDFDAADDLDTSQRAVPKLEKQPDSAPTTSSMKRPREEDDEDEREHIKEPSDKKTKVTEPRFFLSSVATSSLIVAEIPRSATKFIGIRNLVRPFSVPALKGYMETFGSVKTFWLNNIKSHCIVEFETVEESFKALQNVHGIRWPEHGRALSVEFLPKARAQSLMEIPKNSATSSETAARRPTPGMLGIRTLFAKATRDAVQSTVISPVTNKALTPTTAEKPKSATFEPTLATVSRPEEIPIPCMPKIDLDKYFKKTTTKPVIYYKLLSDEEVAERKRKEAELAASKAARTSTAMEVDSHPENDKDEKEIMEPRTEVKVDEHRPSISIRLVDDN